MADFQGSLPIKTVANGDVASKICDTAGVNELVVNSDGSINVVASATDLDIRDLTHASDSVKVGDGTDLLAINADGSINATVSATDLDIRDIDAASDNIAISDGTDTLAINADGSINATVSATDLDIRDLTHASDSVKVGDGTEFLAVNTDGSINVVSTQSLVGKICDYGTSAAVAKDGTANFDYVVTNAKTFIGSNILVGSRGNCKVNFGTYDGTTFTSLGFYFQQPAFNLPIPIPCLTLAGNGTKLVRVIVTNLDNATDLYCTIQGTEQ